MSVLRRFLLVVGFISLTAWLAIGLYLRATNTWGSFAVAPLLLPLFLIAASVAALGVIVCAWSWRQRRIDVPMSLVVLVHGALLWYASTHS
jgi:hypothetical protein